MFRSAAVLLGLSLFVFVEAGLAVFDVGRPDEHDDPFVGFAGPAPLFALDDSGQRYEIPKARLRFFAPDSFPARKDANTFRIFCLGGSTVQGRPFSTPTSFTTWLKLRLAAADPQRNWEVVNCGGISYASYRLVPIMEECLRYEPDLLIVCTGHNEFLEERTYGHLKHAPAALKAVQRTLGRLRTYTLLRSALSSVTGESSHTSEKTELPAVADALLDYQDGIKAYHRDAEFRAGVIAHYEHNVRRMIALADRAGVPLILIRPPSNLCDCPPFKSQHRDNLSAAELGQWQSLLDEAKRHYGDDLAKSIDLFRQALDVDDQYAATHYELGKCYQLTGERELARESFGQARELDICPLRMIAPLEEALAEAANDTGTPLIDAFAMLEAECKGGILGDEVLVDHVHPKYRGHQMIAAALADEMVHRGWLKPEPGWEERADEAWQRHFDSLPSVYFARGLRELRALREWAAGRADGPKLESRKLQ